MTDCIWTGAAAKRRQVDLATIALTWAPGDTYTLTIADVDFTIIIGTLVTTGQVATTIKQAFNGETLTDTTASYSTYGGARTIPQFREYNAATVNSSVVAFSVATSGKPVTMTAAESTAGNGTGVLSNSIVATGPNFIDNNDNYTANLANGVRIIFPAGNAIDCLYGTLGIQPSDIIRQKGYRGKVGLALFNTDDAAYPYREYRTRYLTCSNNSAITSLSVDLGDGTGAQRFNVDFGAAQFTGVIFGSGQRLEPGTPPICLLGTNTANIINNLGGDVGFAFFPSESSHLATAYNSVGKTYLGSGVDLGDATIRCVSGTLETNSLTTTSSSVACSGGTLNLNAGNQLTLTVSSGGRVNLRNGGSTIATLKIYGGTVSKETAASITFTNLIQLYDGASFLAEDGNIPTSTQFVLNGCEWADVTVKVGESRTWTLAL